MLRLVQQQQNSDPFCNAYDESLALLGEDWQVEDLTQITKSMLEDHFPGHLLGD